MTDLCSYFGFQDLPFTKEIEVGKEFESQTLHNLKVRLSLLMAHRGIGLVSGRAGTGKTTFVRTFVSALNPGLYRVLYLHRPNLSAGEFYRDLAWELGLTPKARRSDLCRQIAAAIAEMYKNKRQTPVVIIDEAQKLRAEILDEFLSLTNYEMDSRDYLVLLLVGQDAFEASLTLSDNEALSQRIIVRAHLESMTKDETSTYLGAHLKRVGCARAVFDKTALEAIFQTAKGVMRRTNKVATLALEQAMYSKETTVTNEHVVESIKDHTFV